MEVEENKYIMEEDKDIMEVEAEEDIVHLFLYVSHGINISAKNNYYPIETNFNSIVLHSSPLQPAYPKDFKELIDNPCKLILGSCPYIPIEDNNSRRVFLPPLIFGNIENDDETIKLYTGLYYFQLVIDSDSKCKVKQTLKILNHTELIKEFGHIEEKKYITYSQIFKLVTDKVNTFKLKPEDILLSIFSCQSVDSKYKFTINDLMPKRINEVSPALIFNSKNYPKEKTFVSLTIIGLNQLKQGWNDIKHQGCGLNVLSYFGIIDEADAIGKIACLSIKGTSIFRIVDYINDYFINKQNIKRRGYLVYRYEFGSALKIIKSFMENTKMDDYAIIFKMYNENEHNGNTSHTVAIFKQKNKFYYSDPQVGLLQEFSISEQLNQNTIKTFYKLPADQKWKFNFIDIIFTVSDTPFKEGRMYDLTENFIKKILERTPDITYGGLKNRKNRLSSIHKRIINKISIKKISMNKRTIKNKKISINKKSINKRSINKRSINKRSINKNKKRNSIGGGIDEFQRLMLMIDNNHNMESALMIETSKKMEE